jgi:hypothetical protein
VDVRVKACHSRATLGISNPGEWLFPTLGITSLRNLGSARCTTSNRLSSRLETALLQHSQRTTAFASIMPAQKVVICGAGFLGEYRRERDMS